MEREEGVSPLSPPGEVSGEGCAPSPEFVSSFELKRLVLVHSKTDKTT